MSAPSFRLFGGWGLLVALMALVWTVTSHPYPTRHRPLNICSFNIEVFGSTKMAQKDVMDNLVTIVKQYDLAMIMEIRDKEETVIYDFVDMVNKVVPDDPFKVNVSERLGRNTSTTREQYAFMYRPSKLELLETYQWPDKEDHFMRPPYVARFRAEDNAMKEFGFIPNHVSPNFVQSELDAMVDVYDVMAKLWNLEDFIIGGDFNAGCRYLSNLRRKELKMVLDERFFWLFDYETHATTTTKTTSCPYDNFILVGEKMIDNYLPDSALVYHFDEELDLTYEMTLATSDHYPIEMKLR